MEDDTKNSGGDGILSNALEKRITEAFDIFDHSGNKTVDVREVGTILRSLGCCPSEAEIQEILVKVEDHETSSVPLRSFLPLITTIITERKLQPAPPEQLLKAFHTLDKEGKGYISKEYLSKLITEEGEPFTQEELDELLAIAVDSDTGNIQYEYYINQIMLEQSLHSRSLHFVALTYYEEPKRWIKNLWAHHQLQDYYLYSLESSHS